MNLLNGILIGIIVVLGSILTIFILDYDQTITSYESLLHEKLQVKDLITTFKEKYSDRDITEFPDSKGIPYKYVAHREHSDVELILEKDRVVLKAWKDGDVRCIVSNPLPRDILDNCPLKW